MDGRVHEPVLLDETVRTLDVRPGRTYCDFTIGYGGHAAAIAARMGDGRLVGFDRDPQAVAWCRENLNVPNLTLVNDNFANFKKRFAGLGIKKVAGALLDLGVSSPQFDSPGRGFSYRADGPLDMRMDQTRGPTAADYLRKHSLRDLVSVFRRYGEIKNPARAARALKAYAEANENVSTLAAAELIKRNVPVRELHAPKHPARVYFQALRIAVNAELDALDSFLDEIFPYLDLHGVLAVITFHSLEAAAVCSRFRRLAAPPDLRGVPINTADTAAFALLTKKPIVPSEQEKRNNKRSRSARLYAIKRIRRCTT